MRNRKKIIIWPSYFESSLSWSEGRRVAKNLALKGVKPEEIFRAAEDLNMNPVIKIDATYSKRPWRKSGVVFVDKMGSKTVILKDLASKIRINRVSK